MAILINLLLGLLVIVCFLLIFVVLLQRPKSEGLGAAFGGGISDQFLGARATDVFVRFTTWMGGLFFFLSAVLAYLYAHQFRGQTATERALRSAPAPAASAPAIPGPSVNPAAATPPTGGNNNLAVPPALPVPPPAAPDAPNAAEPGMTTIPAEPATATPPAAAAPTPLPEAAIVPPPAPQTAPVEPPAPVPAQPTTPAEASPSPR